jgi:thiamine pyrophosphate-dependent acetolactate synthase large subunit-like protein
MKNIERPIAAAAAEMEWGSDYLAEVVRRLDLGYLAINPGASLKGLHDSLVNYLGNTDPQMLLCLHEEHAVAIAHGYAKVTGKPMGVAVHSNVGVMHASMAVYNAWCDRVPMVILGATGPVDAAQRRPWIDWIHTARDQASLLRDFLKWDDQPASLAAAAESAMRASIIARTAPRGPVYLCFDVSLQEAGLDQAPPLPDPAQYALPAAPYPAPQDVRRVAQLLAGAERPVILAGRLGHAPGAWEQRIALAERLGAVVMTDLKQAAAFPTDHPLHVPFTIGEQGKRLLRDADVVLSLDWLDPAGTLRFDKQRAPAERAVFIQCSPDQYAHNGATMDLQALQPAHTHFLCEPETLVEALLELDAREPLFTPRTPQIAPREPDQPLPASDAALSTYVMSQVLREATRGMEVTLIRTPLGWSNTVWDYRHPLDFLGKDGGAGVGSGPGMAVGAALALQGSGRLPLAVIGDGDFMFSSSAFWTAARYRIPLLVVVANNRSYFNDEIHQERIARKRSRPVENKAIAQFIGDPDIDLAAIARAQGAVAYGPVRTAAQLDAAVREAIAQVQAGRLCVIDATVLPGYES